MSKQYYTDGVGIFKLIPPDHAVLLNMETQKHTKVAIDADDGIPHGFRLLPLDGGKGVIPEPSLFPAKRQYKKRESKQFALDDAREMGEKKPREGKSSKYWGVGKNNTNGKFKTLFQAGGKIISVGSAFDTEELAAKAVDARLEEMGLPKRNFQ